MWHAHKLVDIQQIEMFYKRNNIMNSKAKNIHAQICVGHVQELIILKLNSLYNSQRILESS